MEPPRTAPPEIPGYEVLAPLATGGMAEVWLAQRQGAAELVVLKRLLPRFAKNRHTRERILREAQIGAIIAHPNVARTLDAGVVGNDVYIATEYVAGKDLESLSHTLARNQQPFPASLVTRIFSEVLEGLHAAHEASDSDGRPVGLVHRDLSPRNVLLGFDGQVKIIDFGLARANLGQYRTEPGSVLGTYRYMSPEQAIGEPVDRRSDIFTLGTSMYELYTGTWLFDAKDKTQILRQIVSARLPPPSRRNPNVPTELDEVIQTAMAHAPSDRFPTAKALRSALAAAVPHWTRTPLESAGLLLRQVFPHDHDRSREQQMLALHRGPTPDEPYARATMDQISFGQPNLPSPAVTEIVRERGPRVHQRLETLVVGRRDGPTPTQDMVYLPTGAGQPTPLTEVEANVREAVRPWCDLFHKLGAGGMSRIYVGHQIGTTQIRAVKVFTPQRGSDLELARERFRREAQVLERAEHPTIPAFVGLDESNPALLFMVMELVDGVTLEELRRSQGGRIPAELLFPLVLDYLDGLAHVHELKGDDGQPLGFAHRDISPDNLMVSFSGEPKLIDFGIAKQARQDLTHVGAFLGKPEYADPQRFGRRADARSDIYALAVVMFEMLTGHPFVRGRKGEETVDILHRAAGERMDRRLSEHGFHIPRALAEVIARAAEHEPDARFPTARAFREALLAASASTPLAARDQIAVAVQRAENARQSTFEALREGVEEHEASVYVPAPAPSRGRALSASPTLAPQGVPRAAPWVWVAVALGSAMLLGLGIGLGLGLTRLATLPPSSPPVVARVVPVAPTTAPAPPPRPLAEPQPPSEPVARTDPKPTLAPTKGRPRAPRPRRAEAGRRVAPSAPPRRTDAGQPPAPAGPTPGQLCRGAPAEALLRLETWAKSAPEQDRACFQNLYTVVSAADRWAERCRPCAQRLLAAARSAQD